jgi:hypothetical protein
MIFASLKPDHWFFYVIDGIIYALLFLILGPALHMCLRLLARHQADEHKGKAFLAMLLILLCSAAVTAQPWAENIGYYVLIPCLFLGAVILRLVCWVSVTRGLVIMLLFGAIVFGVYAGIMKLANRVLPEGRVTLAQSIKRSMGLIDQFAGKPADPMTSGSLLKGGKISNLLMRAKSGVRLEAESFASAVALLKDPQQLQKLTMEHTEDLKALDLIVEGETLTPEDMVEMGVVNEEAKKGMTVLESVNATNEITEQDVEDVALLIRSVRKDGTQVTPNDALALILEARKRVGSRSPLETLVKLTTQNTADLTSLGSVLDGGKMAPEQLAGMGIDSEDARQGIGVLEGIRTTNDIAEQDVGKVVSLLRSVRKDGTQVTTNDALVVINEAMKRAGRSPTNLPWLTLSTNTMAAKPLVLISSSAAATTAVRVVIHQRSRHIDPLLALDALQRAAWNRSQTGLVVSAVMAFSGGNAMAIVNGEMIHTGDIVSVTSEGQDFPWRLATLNGHVVVWEPVVNTQNGDESTLIRWQ